MNEENKLIAFIRELLKDKSEEEILEAEENFREYLLVVKEIADRLESDENPEIIEDFSQEG